MTSFSQPVVLFFAFANDRTDPVRYLRNLPEELRQVRAAMAPAVERGLCETVERSNVTLDEVLDVFQDSRYRDRVVVFHFGGHAGSAALLLESSEGETTVAHASGLARFLGEQRGLELVLLNGCSSQDQAQYFLDAGVPAVLATSQAIDDSVATEFARRFYQSLASGATIRIAYTEAAGAVETRYGRWMRRDLTLINQPAGDPEPLWALFVAPGAEERLERWNLLYAAGDPQDAHLILTRHFNRRLSSEGDRRGEAEQYLSPYSLSVPLVGRKEVLDDQWRWMLNGRPVSVRVMTARAGAGKTRLALELCSEAARSGWVAGFLTENEMERFRSHQNLSRWGWKRPTLIVVDYAASRARLLRRWLTELADHPGREGAPLRLLLLEREANCSGGWWREAFGVGGGDAEAVEQLLDPVSGAYPLPALASPEDRRAVLTSILERTGSSVRPPMPGTSPGFERRLAELSWGGEPLCLLMAGLVAARAGFGEVLALSAPDLGLRIARHEIGRIHEMAQARDPKIPKRFLAHLVAYVTLCQGLSHAEVEEVVAEEKEALRYPSAGDPPEVLEALAAVLPGDEAGFAPILPDVVGEAVALEALGAGGGPEKALLAVSRATRRARERVTASLVHLAQDYGAVRPESVGWLTRLAEEGAGDLDALRALVAQLPQSTVALLQPAAELTQRAVNLAREQGAREHLAGLLNDLSVSLGGLGSAEAALEAMEESVSIYRGLAASRPEAFLPELAMSLSNLAARLSAQGSREAARRAGVEAVSIYRDLSASRAEAFRPNLARSLSNLSACLNALGLQELALRANEESVSIFRDLAASRPDSFRSDLAMVLSNLVWTLAGLGRPEASLGASQESVSIYRELAASSPDAYRSNLARSLNNLSVCLSAMASREAALETIEEAVSIFRGLVTSHPDAFGPGLAMSLNNLSACLSALGSGEAALGAIEESVSIFRELAASRPDAIGPDLASALDELWTDLNALGKREAAVAAVEESVSLYRKLAASLPDTFRPALARSLYRLSGSLYALGRWQAASAAVEESVPIYRELAASRPDAFLRDLAVSLDHFSCCLGALEMWEAASAASEESVPIYRDLAASQPDAFRSGLGSSLYHLSVILSNLGKLDAALAAIEESVPIYRDLAASQPDAFRTELAMSLHHLSNMLSDLGRRVAAVKAIEESVSIYRTLAASQPDAFRSDLAMSLDHLSGCLGALGMWEAALAAIGDSVPIYRDLVASRPDAFRPGLARSLYNQSIILSNLGKPEAALAASEEAVSIHLDLAASQPDAFRPALARSLDRLSGDLSRLGRREAALGVSEEAVSIYREVAVSRPDAIGVDLAMSLNNLSNVLSGLGRCEEGLAASEEAVRLLSPRFLANPAGFQRMMATLVRVYGQAAQKANCKPDRNLLGPLLPFLKNTAGLGQEKEADPAV